MCFRNQRPESRARNTRAGFFACTVSLAREGQQLAELDWLRGTVTCCARPESSSEGGASLGFGDTREAPGGTARPETWRGQRLRREPQVHHPLSARTQRRPGSMVRVRRPESPSRNAPAGCRLAGQEGQQARDPPETEHRNFLWRIRRARDASRPPWSRGRSRVLAISACSKMLTT